jgi:Immunoglobulin I-set domain
MKRYGTTRFAPALIMTGLLALALMPGRATAQGTVNFSDFVSSVVFSHVYGPQSNTPGTNLTGNSAIAFSTSTPYGDYPAGTNSYDGPLLGGSAIGPTNEMDFTNGFLWTAQLWAAAGSNAPVSSLEPVWQYTTTLRTGPSAGSAGFIAPVCFTAAAPDPGIPGAAQDGNATCQLRVWYNGGGTIESWDDAEDAGVLTGASAVFTVSGLGADSTNPPPLPANLAGLQSFSLNTPEEWTVLPQFVAQPNSVTAPQGSEVTFRTGAYGAMTYQWQLNGTNLADDARVTGSQSEFLSIASARMGDAGGYQVVISNLSGTNISSAATLTVTVQAPTLRSAIVSQSNGSLSLAWNTPPGQLCQIQYNTNLSQSGWVNLGGPITVTNGGVSATDGLSNSLRFYRLVLLP